MSNRVLVKFGYDKSVLIDASQLPPLLEILEGAPVVEYNYVESERVDFMKDEPYHVSFSNSGNHLYKTQAQYEAMVEEAKHNDPE